jgi:hypothetical protein
MVCVLCGKPIQTGSGVHAKIGEREYVFDKDECLVICERLNSVYGNDFCISLNS